MRPDAALAGVCGLVCALVLGGCASRPAPGPSTAAPTPSVGALWPPSDPAAAGRAAIGRAYGLFPPIEANGSDQKEIPIPSWVTAAIVTMAYDGPVGSRGFIVTTLDDDNMPAGDTLASSQETHYRGISVFGVDTQYHGHPTKILVQDWGKGPWTLTISPVALAPVLTVPGAKGDYGTSVFLYTGPAARWTFTQDQDDVSPAAFTVAQFGTDKARHVLVDQLVDPSFHGTVRARPGPTVVIVDSDRAWRLGA